MQKHIDKNTVNTSIPTSVNFYYIYDDYIEYNIHIRII